MMRLLSCVPVLAVGMILSAAETEAAPLIFQSSEKQTSLVELYTSEGCSSCPPAEAWFSQLKASPGLWRDFVPVAFHVDYWNYLGWPDRWSREDFSDRQRDYAKLWGSASIYTPELVLNGAEWHRWFWQKQVPPGSTAESGVLRVSSTNGIQWQVVYTLPGAPGGGVEVYQLHTALLICGVGSEVTAGENAGRHLEHDFAALNLTEQPLVSRTNEFKEAFKIDEKLEPATGRLALAVWVSQNGKSEPVQAAGGWLDSSPK